MIWLRAHHGKVSLQAEGVETRDSPRYPIVSTSVTDAYNSARSTRIHVLRIKATPTEENGETQTLGVRTRRGKRLCRCKAVKCGLEIPSTYVFRTAVTLLSSGKQRIRLSPFSRGRERRVSNARRCWPTALFLDRSRMRKPCSPDKSYTIDEKYRCSIQSVQLLSEKWQFFAWNRPEKYYYSEPTSCSITSQFSTYI